MRAVFGRVTDSLEPEGQREGADTGDPQVSVLELNAGGATQAGLWACTTGGWAITDRPATEVVLILEGRVRMTDAGGDSREIRPGEVMVLPKGWSGRRVVLETTREPYVVVG
jgi:hypothetical protein